MADLCHGGDRKDSPEQLGERSAAVNPAGRNRVAPESVGTKRAAPEQASSGCPAKRSRVCSKM
jgi:hypothetical protein